jgi:biopolymer transport protein ExbD
VSGSRLARRQARHHRRYRGRNDLNIVPMLDVMVILVFFLIFTAVQRRAAPAAATGAGGHREA